MKCQNSSKTRHLIKPISLFILERNLIHVRYVTHGYSEPYAYSQGEKDHACDTCRNRYKDVRTLHRHQRVVHFGKHVKYVRNNLETTAPLKLICVFILMKNHIYVKYVRNNLEMAAPLKLIIRVHTVEKP